METIFTNSKIPPGTVAIERNLSTLQVFQPESKYQTMGSPAMIKPETNKVYPFIHDESLFELQLLR